MGKYGSTPTGVETLGAKLNEFGFVVSVSNKKNQFIRMIDMIWAIFSNSKKSDFVFIDTYSGKAFYFVFICSFICQKLNIRYITILRGGNLPREIKRKRILSKIIFDNSFLNISPSFFLQEQFKNFDFNTKYIPNFIEFRNYSFKKRIKCRPKLLWVRSFHKIYNPVMAINVVNRLINKYPNLELCMVGPEKDGSMRSCKELVTELKILKNVTFTGLLSKKEWIRLSQYYDIFINTTNYDNHPVSVVEAMALGFPIVSTKVGGLKYLHEEGKDVLFVQKNDVNGMLKKIEGLIDGEYNVGQLSLNARNKAKCFDWESVKEDWENILR